MSPPTVTVLMTVRNGEPYLSEAIRSILSQTYGDFRFLILDNASTDRTREIVRAFVDSRIDLVELPSDLGQTVALNRGLSMIESPYVARIDADDIAYPKRLALQIAYLDAHPDVALVAGNVDWFDVHGRMVRKDRIPSSDAELAWSLSFANLLAHASITVRRDAILAVGGYDETFLHAMDYELYWSLMRKGLRLACLREKIGAIRLSPSSASYGFGALTIQEPALTQLRTLHHVLPTLPPDRLEAAHATLSARGNSRSETAVTDALEVLLALYSAVASRRPVDQSALRRIRGDLARRVALLGWSCRDSMPRAAQLAESSLRDFVAGEGRRNVYAGMAEAALDLALAAGKENDRTTFGAELRRAASLALQGAILVRSSRVRLARSLVETGKTCLQNRWWSGAAACALMALSMAPFLITRRCVSMLVRWIRKTTCGPRHVAAE